MSHLQKEYNASATNTIPCYSNMKCYGSRGMYRPIIPPTPVTVQPWEFNLLRPHKMPKDDLKPNSKEHNCVPYRTLDGTCRVCWSKS